MIVVFNVSDGSWHHATNALDKFYANSADHIGVEVEEYDPAYTYTYENGVVVKGDMWTVSEEDAAMIEADRVANLHKQARMMKYPNVKEQLDMLFHDIHNGTLDTSGEFYTAIKAVKDAHPKP
jgi:hypothetical protein